MKRSTDGGATWSPLAFPAGTAMYSDQPTIVFDAIRRRLVLQFNSANSNWQVTSDTDGLTWTAPRDLGAVLGPSRGTWVGPGVGIQLLNPHSPSPGRLLFIGHYGAYDYDLVWYSDDGGDTYTASETRLPHMDEAQLVELSTGAVLANMRNDHYLPGDCRGVANSTNGGASFGAIAPDRTLIEPICMASILRDPDSNAIFFSNPASTTQRVNMTIRRSDNDAAAWPLSLLVDAGPSAYSCLTLVPQPRHIGLLWEQSSPAGCVGESCQMVFAIFPSSLQPTVD
jgi:sialidase-1